MNINKGTSNALRTGAGTTRGSQTLVRGLELLEHVSRGPVALTVLAGRLGLSRSTVHRLATTLLQRRYLNLLPRRGYSLGPRVLELGARAGEQIDLVRIGRPYLNALVEETGDTASLAVLDDRGVLLMDLRPGRRRLSPNTHVGEILKPTRSGLGRALLLDHDGPALKAALARDLDARGPGSNPQAGTAALRFLPRMAGFARSGYACDLQESDADIRCVAAPVRGADGHILAAIGLSTAPSYLDDASLLRVAATVLRLARDFSAELGWSDATHAGDRTAVDDTAGATFDRGADLINPPSEAVMPEPPHLLEEPTV